MNGVHSSSKTKAKPRRRLVIFLSFVALATIAVCLAAWLHDGLEQRAAVATPASLNTQVEPTAGPPGSNDDALQDDIDGFMTATIERASAKLDRDVKLAEIGPHPWQQTRVKNIRGESIQELVANLGNEDDFMPAELSISGELGSMMNAGFCPIVVTRLARVKRLFELAGPSRDEVRGELRSALGKTIDEYPQIFAGFFGEFVGKTFMPSSHAKHFVGAQYTALSATYLLAELQDFQALPIMLRSYEIHKPSFVSLSESMSPISPAFTLVAMHRLIDQMPEQDLSPEARERREAFLAAAMPLIPDPTMVATTKWDAELTSYDPRVTVTGLGGAVMERDPIIGLPRYPDRFTDGAEIVDGNGKVSPRAEELFRLAEEFIVSAFPDAASPPTR